MTYLVIDTNVFEKMKFNLNSVSFELLEIYVNQHEELEKEKQIKIVLPNIIFEEVEKRYKSNLKKLLKEFKKNYKELSIFPLETHLPEININMDEEVTFFSNNFKEIFKTKFHQFEIIDETTMINLTEIKKRCLLCKKPFSPDGKLGFRDSLIWEFIKNYSKLKNEQIIFVSNDSDFLKKGKNELHDELISELINESVNNILVYRHFEELEGFARIREEKEIEELFDKYTEYFDEKTLDTLIADQILENINDYIKFPEVYDNWDMSNFEISHIEVENILTSDEKIDILELSFDLLMNTSVYVFKADYWYQCEEGFGDFEVNDSDYNEWYAELTNCFESRISLLIKFNRQDEIVENFEITKINEYYYDSITNTIKLRN